MQKDFTGDASDYRLSWPVLRRDLPIWALLLGVLALTWRLYPALPDPMPSHWNIQGQVDGYMSKTAFTVFMPLLNVGIYIFMLVLPLIDPRRRNYTKFAGAYTWVRWAVVIFLAGLQILSILFALGAPVDIGRTVQAGVAVLFILIGNFMSQVRHNYFMGIRTPWTLADEEVWTKTHRLGGRLFVAAGFLGLLTVFWVPRGIAFAVTIGGVLIACLGSVVYSYLLFAAKQRQLD